MQNEAVVYFNEEQKGSKNEALFVAFVSVMDATEFCSKHPSILPFLNSRSSANRASELPEMTSELPEMTPSSISVAEKDYEEAVAFYKSALGVIELSEKSYLSAFGFSCSVDTAEEAGAKFRLQSAITLERQGVTENPAKGDEVTNDDVQTLLTDRCFVTRTLPW